MYQHAVYQTAPQTYSDIQLTSLKVRIKNDLLYAQLRYSLDGFALAAYNNKRNQKGHIAYRKAIPMHDLCSAQVVRSTNWALIIPVCIVTLLLTLYFLVSALGSLLLFLSGFMLLLGPMTLYLVIELLISTAIYGVILFTCIKAILYALKCELIIRTYSGQTLTLLSHGLHCSKLNHFGTALQNHVFQFTSRNALRFAQANAVGLPMAPMTSWATPVAPLNPGPNAP